MTYMRLIIVILISIALLACRQNPHGKSHADGELNIVVNVKEVCLIPNFQKVYVGHNNPRKYDLKYLKEVVVRIDYSNQEPFFLEKDLLRINEKICFDNNSGVYNNIINSPKNRPPFIVVFGLSDKGDRYISFQKS